MQSERLELSRLAEERGQELPSSPVPLHSKVSLLAGGNICRVTADAVVNAANTSLSTGKGSEKLLDQDWCHAYTFS